MKMQKAVIRLTAFIAAAVLMAGCVFSPAMTASAYASDEISVDSGAADIDAIPDGGDIIDEDQGGGDNNVPGSDGGSEEIEEEPVDEEPGGDFIDGGGNEYDEIPDAPDAPDLGEDPTEESAQSPDFTTSFAEPADMAAMQMLTLPPGEQGVPAGIVTDTGTLNAYLRQLYSYGIISGEVTNNTDQRTNLATASLRGGVYTYRPDLAGGREIPFIIRTPEHGAEIPDGLPGQAVLRIKPENNAKYTASEEVRRVYHNSADLGNEVSNLLLATVRASQLLNRTPYTGTAPVTISEEGSCLIDLTAFGENEVVVINANELTDFFTSGRLTIKKHAGQVIALNINGKDPLSIGTYNLEIDGVNHSSSVSEGAADDLRSNFISKVIWNVRDILNLDLADTAGTFLANKENCAVTVSAESAGTVSVNGSLAANATWYYLYGQRTSEATFAVKKVSDTGKKIPVNAFEFTISAVTGGAPLPRYKDREQTTTVNGQDGFATFETIKWDSTPTDKSYIYKITETGVIPAEQGKWKISSEPVYAKVSFDESGNTSIRYYSDSAATTDERKIATVVNSSLPVSVVLKGKKDLSVKAGFKITEGNIETFEFNLVPKTKGRESDEDTQLVTGAGNFAFKALEFEKPGTYNYEIKEITGKRPGYKYDKTIFIASVEVKQTDEGLVADVKYSNKKTGEEVKSIGFTNTYAPDPVYETIKVKKEIDGATGAGDEFEFIMSHTGSADETTSVVGEGEAHFARKRFGRPGTYTYKIVEKLGDLGYVYDDSVYYVRIEIDDIGGVLSKDVKYYKKNVVYGEAVFSNRYVTGDFTFYKVRFDKQNTGVKDAEYGLFKIKYPDRTSKEYKRAAEHLARGTVDFDELTRIQKITSSSIGKVTFTDLMPNEFYVISELSAPRGFQRSKNPVILHTSFSNNQFITTVTDSGSNTMGYDAESNLYKWYEHKVHVIVNKINDSRERVSGAILTLYDESTGKPIERWQSEATEGHQILSKLTVGGKYRIVENRVPTGYYKADDVVFTVDAAEVVNTDHIQTVNMVDKKKGGGGGGGGGGSGSGAESGEGSKTEGSKTMDPSRPLFWIIVGCAAACLALVVVLGRKRKK